VLIGQTVFRKEWYITTPTGGAVDIRAMISDVVARRGEMMRDARLAVSFMDGPIRFISVNAAPFPGTSGQHLRVVCAVTDVTAQTEAEEAREAALEEARRATQAKSLFLARISHEMRTPLNGVLGMAELLAGMVSDPEQKRMVVMLQESGNLLLNIINDLLDMSRIEAGQLELEQTPFSPVSVAERLLAAHAPKAREKGLDLRFEVGPGGERRRFGDGLRIAQMLHNLVGNSLKFTDSGHVAVTLSSDETGALVMTVADTGIGMTDNELAHVFEDFGQADSSIARRYGGTGLGMPITRQLVKLMSGEIEVHSRPGAGTRVQISLPLPIAPNAPVTLPPAMDANKPARLDGLRVLAADDNRTNRLILRTMLQHLGAWTVMCASGSEVLERHSNEDFDVVILDISMPVMDGLEVFRELREAERLAGRRPIPVLAYTANAMTHQIASYRDAGFDDCLIKPLSTALLAEKLRNCLPARAPAS